MVDRESAAQLLRHLPRGAAVKAVKEHFVTFQTPAGASMKIEITIPIKSWCVDTACAIARGMEERDVLDYWPYGFVFSTRERGPNELDSREAGRSGVYYLGGEILTIEDFEDFKGKTPSEITLLGNMRLNMIEHVIINENSWRRVVEPYYDDKDAILAWQVEP